jgi:hypothetical protein
MLSYTHDAMGQIDSLGSLHGSGPQLGYLCDSANRLLVMEDRRSTPARLDR